MATPTFYNTEIARIAGALWGVKLGNASMTSVLDSVNAVGLAKVANDAYTSSFGSVSNATVAAIVVANAGITGAPAVGAVAAVKATLDAAPAGGKGAALITLLDTFAGMTADPTYGVFATAFNTSVASALIYSQTGGTTDSTFVLNVTTFNLGLGLDAMTGSAGDDVFNARIVNNFNTLQSGDSVNGGAGNDTLNADMGSSQAFAVTPETTGIETFTVRGQSRSTDTGDNNVSGLGRVNIDAERMVGVTRFETNNSRADVIIEDVRILASQITSDITIAMVETDPGHVDYGVYFNQLSLKNQASTSSSIVLRLLDTYNTALLGSPSLKDSTYGAFTFTYIQSGVTKSVTLGADSTGTIKVGPGTIQEAQTLPALVAALQAEVNLIFGAGAATVTLGQPYSVPDPVTTTNVTGNEIVITTNAAGITIPPTAAQPATTGWTSSGVAPAVSNFYTFFSTDALVTSSLVTSKVILDDVGLGSTGGDLVIGGMSTGVTSGSQGVQRFEIEVRDNSKMESINSTNNTLREVTLVNGLTSSASHAYVVTVKDAGNLTVNGQSGINGANVSGFSNRIAVGTATDFTFSALPGVASSFVTAAQVEAYGFTDVRLIDASAMRGKFEFTAQVTSASLAKYLDLKDIQALPAGDNIAFTYNGGTVDDTMFVSLDSLAVGSHSNIMVGREDFTFTSNGGAGNDWITVFVGPSPPAAVGNPLIGGNQAWYTNQKANKNITIDGGAGDDVIRKPGAGDVVILAGAGNDTVYADNSGALPAQSVANSQAAALAAAYQLDETAEQNSALAVRATANTTSATLTARASTALNTLAVAITGSTAVPTTDAAVTAATTAAVTAGVITAAQKTSIDTAINLPVDGVAPTAAEIASALAIVTPLLTSARTAAAAAASADTSAGTTPQGLIPALLAALVIGAADAAVTAATAAAIGATGLTAAQAAQINDISALVAGAATAAEVDAMVRIAEAALTNSTPNVGNLTATADALVDATTVVSNASAVVANLTTLQSAIAVGTLDAAVTTATTNAVLNGSITAAQKTAIDAAAVLAGAGSVDAAELAGVSALIAPALAAANVTLTAANTARTTAVNTNNTAIAAVITAGAVAATSAAEAAAAAAALTAATTANTTAQAVVTNLGALKAAIQTGSLDQNVLIATTAAVANGSITAAQKTAIDAAASAAVGSVTPVTAAEKNNIDVTILDPALVAANASAAITANNLAAATAVSALQATESANVASALLFGAAGDAELTTKAVFVLNTANQLNVDAGYTLVSNDERNLADLKSDVDNSNNFFAATVTVTFKDLVATATVPNTGYKTSDLQINQAIKNAINNNAVLNKLIVATDGPANTLVIKSLIDGVMSNANLAVVLTLPVATGLSTADVTGAAAAYGLPVGTTAADLLTAMTTTLATFNTKGDYTDQLAETGAAGTTPNVELKGAVSITTSDNTITPGAGNDVIVLGTTVGLDALTSSNDTVVFGAAFGNDTIVHFRAGSLTTGGDVLNLSSVGGAGVGGNILGTAFNVNKSVNVATEVLATNGTALLVAGLFADSATAQTHVFVAVDANNIGKLYAVVDTAGVAVGSVTATLVGTIDLADTLWASLTTENFA